MGFFSTTIEDAQRLVASSLKKDSLDKEKLEQAREKLYEVHGGDLKLLEELDKVEKNINAYLQQIEAILIPSMNQALSSGRKDSAQQVILTIKTILAIEGKLFDTSHLKEIMGLYEKALQRDGTLKMEKLLHAKTLVDAYHGEMLNLQKGVKGANPQILTHSQDIMAAIKLLQKATQTSDIKDAQAALQEIIDARKTLHNNTVNTMDHIVRFTKESKRILKLYKEGV